MKYLLDTDHISIIQRGTGPEYGVLAGRLALHPLEDIGVSIISFHEQLLGCHAYLTRAKTSADLTQGYDRLERFRQHYAESPVVAFDAAAVTEYDSLRTKRLRISSMDLRIAAVALSRGLTLLTRNIRDFGKVPGLTTEDWTA